MKFLRRTGKLIVRKVNKFLHGLVDHTETIVILALSAVGLNILLGELPFMFMLPAWIEAPMLIPVVSVFGILGLIKIAELRNA